MPDVTSLPMPEVAPVLSTPDTRIFETLPSRSATQTPRERSEKVLYITYEIERTISEIREGRWRRIALQFPDHMLVDAPWISRALSKGLRKSHRKQRHDRENSDDSETVTEGTNVASTRDLEASTRELNLNHQTLESPEKIFILADTSYGACCVDEVAAEHANADVIVHYGRACLSPTARLPVIYCFTKQALELEPVIRAFQGLYTDFSHRVVLMTDLPYEYCLADFAARLRAEGYTNIFSTVVVHDTQSALPNRTVPEDVAADETQLKTWALFYISEPSPSLLLNLSSKVASIHFFPTDTSDSRPQAIESSTRKTLNRRYALLTSLNAVPICGILVNTLSVRDYMSILKHVRDVILAAGKKSYTFVVGKVNAAKVANFSEVGGWVVIGCWESSLFESKDFWKPVITPFELELALQSDASRVWTGEWISDFQTVLRSAAPSKLARDTVSDPTKKEELPNSSNSVPDARADDVGPVDDSDEESEPPQFDLRTGRYVSTGRPMSHFHSAAAVDEGIDGNGQIEGFNSRSLTRRDTHDLATTRGAFPAAAFFRDNRSWQGLGSDYEIEYDEEGIAIADTGATVEQGRHGIARGYTHGILEPESSKT